MPREVAALYVEEGGIYSTFRSVDNWPLGRDARKYTGPCPVVAHPPCKRWGKYWHGSTRKPHQFRLGEDQGCFAAALTSVRNYGGVLEHPAHSKAWKFFGLKSPKAGEGWVKADEFGGFTCHVEQGHYGHVSRKETWLYAVRAALPDLDWSRGAQRICPKMLERYGYEKARRIGPVALIGGKDKEKIRDRTPPEFARILIGMARSVK